VRKTFLSTLAVAVWLGTSLLCPAQDAPKNLVTVAFSGYDRMAADIDYVAKLIGNAAVTKQLEEMKKAAQDMSLGGVDGTRPWGAVVQVKNAGGIMPGPDDFSVLAFVPVKDFAKLKETLAGLEVEVKDAGDGVVEIDTGRPLYLREKGGWVFVGMSPEALKDTPADPSALLGDLSKRHHLAARISVKNIPQFYRKMFLAQMQMGAQAALRRLPNESDDEYAMRLNVTKQMLQQVTTMVNDLDELLLGWGVDRTKGATFIDFEMTAVAGTKTAGDFAQLAQAKTNFAGFNLPGAALSGNWVGAFSDSDVVQMKSAISALRDKAIKDLKDEGLDGEELKLATQVIGDLFGVIQKTIENKKADMGVVLVLNPGAAAFVAGGLIADGDKLEKVLKQVAEVTGKEDPDMAKAIKLDADKHQGVRFHTFTMPVPDPDAVKVIGPNLEVTVGISDQNLYVALGGPDAAKTLKQVIDKSKVDPDKAVSPLQISVAATPILKFARAVAPDGPEKQIVDMIAAALEQSGGKDHISLTTKSIPNGAATRLEIEEGILKALSMMAVLVTGGRGAGPPAVPGAVPGFPGGALPPEDP